MRIAGRLRVEECGDYRWRLLDPLILDADGFGRMVVPAGFETDLASAPRLVWAIVPPIGRYQRAAVVHDWLYSRLGPAVSRRLADAVFLDAMAAEGVAAWRRWLMWTAVRVAGWRSFKRFN